MLVSISASISLKISTGFKSTIFQKHCFLKKGPKNNYCFIWYLSMVYCLFSYSQCLLRHWRKHLNFTAIFQLATTVVTFLDSIQLVLDRQINNREKNKWMDRQSCRTVIRFAKFQGMLRSLNWRCSWPYLMWNNSKKLSKLNDKIPGYLVLKT